MRGTELRASGSVHARPLSPDLRDPGVRERAFTDERNRFPGVRERARTHLTIHYYYYFN
jgi:hypothetical protein